MTYAGPCSVLREHQIVSGGRKFIPYLLLISCVILAKSIKFSVLASSFIQWMDNTQYIIKIFSSCKTLSSLFHDLMHVLSIACQVK